MGATLDGSACHFRTWAPNAERVTVMGSFNEWRDAEFPLRRDPEGTWSTTVSGVRAADEYLYVIDNRGGDEHNPGTRGLRRVDPWARDTRDSNGNAVVVDVPAELVSSGLASDPFVTPAHTDWLIYQAHVGSFSGNGDGVDTGPTATGTFAQFEQKLPYIKSLGFNAVALLPIHQNPGDGNEGYAPSHLFAPESSYGSPLELRHLIRVAHDTGLAVIFDVVWNHMSDFDNRLWDFDGMIKDGGIFYEGGERTPWGPRLAFWKHEVRDFIVANAVAAFAEYHADGLRVDAADEIAGDVIDAVVAAVRAEPRWHGKLLIIEWGGDDRMAQPMLHTEPHVDRIWALADPRLFASAAGVGRPADVRDSVGSIRELLDLPEAAARIRYLLGSHDSAHDNEGGGRTGFRYFTELAGGRNDDVARAKARLGWALSVAVPGTPMCFMGAECHAPGYWHPRRDANADHDDHRFDWRSCNDAFGLEMRRLVTDANQVWWDQPVLRSAPLEVLHVDEDNGVVAFLRIRDGGYSILCVVNVAASSWPNQGYSLPIGGPARSARVLLDTQAARYGGPGFDQALPLTTTDGRMALSLAPWSLLLLALQTEASHTEVTAASWR